MGVPLLKKLQKNKTKQNSIFHLIGESDGVSILISRFLCGETETLQLKTSNELRPLEPNPIKVQTMQCIAGVLIRTLRATGCVFNLTHSI